MLESGIRLRIIAILATLLCVSHLTMSADVAGNGLQNVTTNDFSEFQNDVSDGFGRWKLKVGNALFDLYPK